MPIYEYRCSSCGFQHEYLQKVSDPRLTDCPECGKPTFDKLLSAAGFQLKGNGWYVTDFRDKGKPASKDKPADKADDSTKSAEPVKKSDGDKASDSSKSEQASGATT